MTPEQLHRLIAEGETLDVEFKGEERHPLLDRDLVEAVVCLANQPGQDPRWLLVGVEDDGRVTGARPRHEHGRTDLPRLVALVSSRTRPALSVRAEELDVDGKSVLAVEVSPSRAPVGTSEGVFVRRAVGGDGRPACFPMNFHEMQSLLADRGALDFSAALVPEATWEALDPLEFERYRRMIRTHRGRGDEALLALPDVELAKALGAVAANGGVHGIRVAGLLLFGKEEALRRHLPAHEVAFQVLHGTAVDVNDFVRWPLLHVMEAFEERFNARNREQELQVGLFRIGVPDYPHIAFREGLANALIHRDYTRLGSVFVQWHDDHLEISSPGGFPEGVRLDNLLVTPPRPRNPLLADALKRAGIVERTARGIDAVFTAQLRNGRPAPSYQRSDATSVTLVLPGGDANLAFVRVVAEEERTGSTLGVDGLLLLNGLWQERSLTTDEAARLIQKPVSDARGVLGRLVEGGFVEEKGTAKARVWQLSAATYRRLGQKAAYVRQRGFEPLQQEQMVLQYAHRHGRLTRAETAELCAITPNQAYKLIHRLVESGRLVRQGTSKKGSWYTLK